MATLTTLRTSLVAALDYEATASLSKAKDVVSLCRQLLVVTPTSSGTGGSSVGWDITQLKTLKEEAQAYISSNTAGSRTRFLGTQNDFGR